jgi:hypothetical protein
VLSKATTVALAGRPVTLSFPSVTAPLALAARDAPVSVIGFLDLASPEAYADRVAGIRQGLYGVTRCTPILQNPVTSGDSGDKPVFMRVVTACALRTRARCAKW